MSGNLEGSDDKRSRAERRWRRRELNCYGSAPRTTVKVENKISLEAYVSVIDLDEDSRVDSTDINDKTGYNNADKDDCIGGSDIVAETGYNDIDVDKDNHIDGSDIDIDVNTGYNNDNDDDSDPDYKKFLENLRVEGNSYVYSVIVGNQRVHIRYEQDEEEENNDDKVEEEKGFTWRGETGNLGIADSDSTREQIGGSVDSQQNLETERRHSNRRSHSGTSRIPENNCNTELDIDVDEDYEIMLNSRMRDYDSDNLENVGTGNLGIRGVDSIREQTTNPVESLHSQETERGPCNKSRHSEASRVQKSNDNTELEIDVDEDYQTFLNSYRTGCDSESWVPMTCELKGTSLSVRRNSGASYQAFDTPLVQSDYDEDYLLFLNSNPIIDGDLYMCDRNIISLEGDSNSSDSDDLILLEPNQIGENTPFIPSKMFDSSCFENETNPRQLPACDQSQFRRRLMEYLEKPYDQEEYDGYLTEVHRQRHKERHFETRQGVVKSYPTYGFNKSYLELYPGRCIWKVNIGKV
ncbi:hypothetical protein TanjilG_05049 [Lupinus angustifolius]|uniref:Uncharacterized protein n=1 Tax=Lupinus angustifolius TaxID=3871 RepID=A0A4P1R518_LUPAN|nr:hypothetical protein TanjilG_05049 [Lupinus angustifolius]